MTKLILSSFVSGYKNAKTRNEQACLFTTKDFNNTFDFEIDWNLEDIAALAAFRSEAFIVAGITADDALNTLKSEAEKAFKEGITFSEWKKEIKLKGFDPENPYYLRTNFNTAVNNAYLAGEYNQAMQNIDILPYFRYVAVMDDRVRDEHAELHGTVLPKNDPFWDTYYPPNGWNCRCGVEELTENEARNDPHFGKKPPAIKLDEIWKKNTGKDKSIWGKWLSCGENNSALTEIINFLNVAHCPDKYQKTYKDYNRPDWKDLPENENKKIFNTKNLSKEEILTEYEKYLGDRLIYDVMNTPVKLLKSKRKKFDKDYSLNDLKQRFKYIYHIDDVIKKPDEIWTDSNKRYTYLKKYKHNIILLCDLKEGVLEYFNLYTINDKKINKKRKGYLVFPQQKKS